MSHKISQAKRKAFLAALAATGNQTLSAERAKVSRSWVCLHRSSDAGFDAACRAAIEQARQSFDKLRMDGEGGRKPSAKWAYLEGEELVLRGTGGSACAVPSDTERERGRPQIVRARVRQWSPRAEERFLAALMATCNVKLACAEVGLSPASAYNHRHRWVGFARRWDAAVEIGYLEIEAALIAAAGSMLEGVEPDEVPPLRGMTVKHAIHVLHMHKHRVRGLGKAPGKAWRRPKTLEELTPSILRKLEPVLRAAGIFATAPEAGETALPKRTRRN